MDAVGVDLYNTSITGDIACTLTTEMDVAGRTGPKVLLFANNRREADYHELENICSTVTAKYGTGGLNTPIVLDISAGTTRNSSENVVQTLRARMGTGGGNVPLVIQEEQNKERKYILRRLTPLECCRLQGFPDWWTDGAEGSDSAIYKMWGNGIALPCAADVIGRLAKELEK